MSVSSVLAFMLAGVAAKAKSVQVARRSERIAELEAERDRQYEENAALIVRIAELEGDVARANIQYRRDQELIDIWRDRALTAFDVGRDAPARPDWRQYQAAAAAQAAQAQYNPLAQYNAQQAMNAQNYQAMGLLGAQQLSPLEWCNCVPARHDMFLRGV